MGNWRHPIEAHTSKNYLEVFVDLYNLRLQTDTDLNEDSLNKLLAFFEKYAPDVLAPKTKEEYDQLTKQSDRNRSAAFRLTVLKGTLDGYELVHGVSWFDSSDFKSFLSDYQVMTRIVDTYLQSQEVFKADLRRIDQIGSQLFTRKFEIPLDVGEKIDLKKTPVYESLGLGPLWHGLMIASSVGGAIFTCIFRLVVLKDLEIRRCVLEDCQNIFVPSKHGLEQKFCSVTCRVKQHRRIKRNASCDNAI